MDPVIARKTWRTVEPVHGMIYFAPEADEHYRRAGITEQRSGYFASRSAAMGEASAELVTATFFNFEPDTVRAAMAGVWTATTPTSMLGARSAAAHDALRRLLGDAATGPAIDEAAELAREAALAACDRLEGRPLFAAHAQLEWPDEPLLVLWHAQTLLREFRGDGHIAVLVADGVSAIEALITHGGSGEVAAAVLRTTRNWSDEAWTTASDALIERGWIDGFGALTEAGVEHRQWVEDRTDRLALAPYEAIGEDGCTRLRELARPLSRAIVANGGLPV
jgi:hypothetical protein